MGKDIEKKLVGQPIFNQIIELLPRNKFDLLVSKYGADKYYKQFLTKRICYFKALSFAYVRRVL